MTVVVGDDRAEGVLDDSGLWPGDAGTLPDQTRRAILRLVRGPYLAGARERQVWTVLLSDEAVIRSRLADMFLDLVIDRDNEVAFVRNAPTEAAPRAVRAEALTFLDTAMLLVLRQTLLSEEGGGRVIVGKAELFEQLTVFRTPDRDEKDFASRLNSSWGKMQNKLRVLHAVGEDRAEISPVLRLIVDADQVRAITAEYDRLAREGGDDEGERGERFVSLRSRGDQYSGEDDGRFVSLRSRGDQEGDDE